MTESQIHARLRRMPRDGSDRPIGLKIVYDGQGRPKAAEIRGVQKSLWSWPKGYRAKWTGISPGTPPGHRPHFFKNVRPTWAENDLGFVA